MLNLLQQIYLKLEKVRGRDLVILLLIVFINFLLIGLGVGYISNKLLTKNELTSNSMNIEKKSQKSGSETSYEGRVRYVDPRFYPQDNISYMLIDLSGKEIILLKSVDQKLVIAEGHSATVYGKLTKTLDKKKDVLLVSRVVIKNAPN